jgi:putative methyltransferase (TIGR04325 family)
MNVRRLAQLCLSERMLGPLERRLQLRGDFVGDYASFEEARAHSTGYDSSHILETVTAAALKVKNGEAAFERDGVAFAEPDPPYPMVSALLRAYAIDARLSVLDFGGSLGSSYGAVRAVLPPIRDLRWSVVEQPHFVARGRALFETDTLRFYDSIAECETEAKPNIVLLSSVLQYLEDPYPTLRAIEATNARHLVLDRTPFIAAPRDKITVQRVPKWIYGGSYPARLFGTGTLLPRLAENWRQGASWRALGGTMATSAGRIEYKGFAFERD